MRLDSIDGNRIRVTLSRRNLRSLLAKLDGCPPASARTIEIESDIGWLSVSAEEDELHYGIRGFGPGPMHSDTEASL
jgi:hypothetical protein